MKKASIFILLGVVALCGIGSFAMMRFNADRMKAMAKGDVKETEVTEGDMEIKVVETGQIDAVKAVEVKSRVSGRVAQLLVEEGDVVEKGQLIAVIDPQETELRVEQDRAQLRGAQSAIERLDVEIVQREALLRSALKQAEQRVAQAKDQLDAQPTLTKVGIRSAEASLASATKERERLVSSSHPTQRTATEANLREARANLVNAEAEHTRQKELLALGYTAGRNVENAQLQLELAKARLATAEENLRRLDDQQRVELERADAAIAQAKAELDRSKTNQFQDDVRQRDYQIALSDLDRAKAQLRDIEVLKKSRNQSVASADQISSVLGDSLRQLGETEIRAPIAGVVTRKLVQEGELVASLSSFSSGTPIIRLEDRTAMMVKLNVNEIDVAKLTLGMPARVSVDAFADQEVAGTVRKIAPATLAATAAAGQAAVVKFEVEVWLDPNNLNLKSGMSAKCTMITDKRAKTLQVPAEYVSKDADGSFVLLKPAKHTDEPKKVRVKTGLTSGARVELLEGVKVGDKLVKPEFTGPARKGAMQFGNDDEQASGDQAEKE
ncbi:MAG: HlyD family efflux transporter periplasmic adaptor subunit [Fimbriimonadaceae bacterium]|nr:HlyD family efflux transporter periplasmic adaptor subunit [Fimbriimonadaceae bacterium]